MKTHAIRRIVTAARHGTVLIYTTIGMVAFAGLVSLGIDTAHVRLVKVQLQAAADAAARYALTGFQKSGVAAGRNNAVSAAGDNTADGTSVAIDRMSDVDFGTWDPSSQTFTVLGAGQRSTANAIRVWARRTAAAGNPVALYFGGIVGKSTFDVTVSSIASFVQAPPTGLIGLNSITTHNHFFLGSYDSSVTTAPTQATAGTSAVMYSNGAVTGSGTDQGNANLGPGGSVSGVTVTGSTIYSTTPISVPSVSMQVVTNPGGVSQAPNLNNGQTVAWPGGTYYFTSLTLADNITINFSGPATIYMDGSVSIHDNNTITAYNSIPGNLKIIQSDGNSFTMHDNNSVFAQLVAPGSTLTFAHDNDTWYGSVAALSVTVHDNDTIFYDVEIAQPAVTTVE